MGGRGEKEKEVRMPFYLKQPEAIAETPIMMSYCFSGHRIRFSTGISIPPGDWNQKSQRPKVSCQSAEKLTMYLRRIESRVNEVYYLLKSDFADVTPEVLRNAIIRDLKLDGRKENLVTYWPRFMSERTLSKKDTYGYKAALQIVKDFGRSKEFTDINQAWFDAFLSHMTTMKYGKNYQGKITMLVRSVISGALKDGVHKNEAFREFTPPKEDVDSIYLNMDELMALHNLKLTGSWAQVRDRFLIGCFTGLRFSDNQKITKESIRDGLLFDKNKKTKTNVVIPIHWVVEDIMARYPSGMPKSFSDVYINREIKLIGEKAKINTPIMVKGKPIKKYNLITTHTARRSFCTNLFLAGVPAMSIMYISGHKTETAFKKYIRITSTQNAIKMASHEYFKRP